MGVLSKFKKEVKRLHKYLSAIGNGIALLKQLDFEMKTDDFKQLEKIDDLSSMIYPLLLVEVCEMSLAESLKNFQLEIFNREEQKLNLHQTELDSEEINKGNHSKELW